MISLSTGVSNSDDIAAVELLLAASCKFAYIIGAILSMQAEPKESTI